jgi:hypothetical protein
VDQISVEEGDAEQIDDEEELQSGGGGVEQNDDPGGFGDGMEVEALLDVGSLGARWCGSGKPWHWRRRGVVAARPSTSVRLGCGGGGGVVGVELTSELHRGGGAAGVESPPEL